MGCDIHIQVEYRTKIDGTMQWCDGNLYDTDITKFHDSHENGPKYQRVCLINEGRNYTLFGLLAGVRNYDIKPIASPRGFPNDASKSIAKEYNAWGIDAHSAGWLTLAELMNAARSHPDLLDDLVAELHTYFHRLFPVPSPLITQNELRIVFWFDN
jgi:hypothetical protein